MNHKNIETVHSPVYSNKKTTNERNLNVMKEKEENKIMAKIT